MTSAVPLLGSLVPGRPEERVGVSGGAMSSEVIGPPTFEELELQHALDRSRQAN